MTDHSSSQPAPVAQRAAVLESILLTRGVFSEGLIEDTARHAEENFVTRNGSQVVARAWTDEAFRARLLHNGKAAVQEMGFRLPDAHRQLVVLENTPDIHNVIVCTLCSCTAFTIIGAAPGWYKDFEYRARVVRESRTVLKEMGLDLPGSTEIRVWDTTADTRYMVLPVRPAATEGWPVERLVDIVTQDSMIGVSRLDHISGTGV